MTKADQTEALTMYVVLARDFSDFLDLCKDASDEALKLLHEMLTTPNDKHDKETIRLNQLGADVVKRRMEIRAEKA